MTPQDYLLIKIAEKSGWEKFKKKVRSIVKPPTRKKEEKVLKGQLKKVKPKTKREQQIERLTGRRWTAGQYARGAGIGAAVGTVGHVLGAAVEGAGKGKFKELITPRRIGRTAAIASLYGAALPAARRIADVEAAKRGAY